eukprot:11167454-Lingulodinium_polyedra.AAC.1
MPPKSGLKRMSNAKVDQVVAIVAQQEERRQHKALYDEVLLLLKNTDRLKLLAVKRLLTGATGDAPMGKCFPRGVRSYGGPPSMMVPNYAAVECLYQATDLPKALFAGLPTNTMRELFLYAIGVEGEAEIPSKRMEMSAFVQHYLEMYTARKCRLE